MNWSYGITTVPDRVNTLLPATLASLASSGFPEPWLFIDGAADITHLEGYGGVTIRHPKGGHLVNWVGALTGLYYSEPKADRYAVFEDDLLACRNLREYLETCPYPSPGYLNLLTHDCNLVLTGPRPGWHRSNQKGKGAVALVFDHAAVQAILSCKELIDRPAGKKLQAADGVVCDCLIPLGYTEYVHYPSLVQHVGVVSSMDHKYGTVRAFAGEDYDPMTLIPQPPKDCKGLT